MGQTFNYTSPMAPFLNGLIASRNAAGYTWLRGRWICLEIDRFYLAEGIQQATITQEIVDKWRLTRSADTTRTLYAKYNIWQQLARYMNRNGVSCYIPQGPKSPPSSSYVPYVFTQAQMERIFEESDKIRQHNANRRNSAAAVPAIIRFLYSTGVRVSEALSIENQDLHLDQSYILLRHTKNRHERLIAINPSMKTVLDQYISFRDDTIKGNLSSRSRLFVKADGTPVTQNGVYSWFKRILKLCAIPHIGNHHGPRVHDLRHTGACHSLAKMFRSGMDYYAIIPILQEWLGHRSPKGSELYLKLTSDMYPDLREKMEIIEKIIKNGDTL